MGGVGEPRSFALGEWGHPHRGWQTDFLTEVGGAEDIIDEVES